MVDDNKVTKVFFLDGTSTVIKGKLYTHSISEGILVLSFERGFREQRANYFIPIDKIKMIVHDKEDIVNEVSITNANGEQLVIQRLVEEES